MIVVPPNGKPRKPKLTGSVNKGGRGDLKVWCNPLGGYHYWHRVVAFAWREDNSYEILGGSRKVLPGAFTWPQFVKSGLVVDHGWPHGPTKVLISALRICTQERNQELQNEREASRAPRTRKKTPSPTKKKPQH